MKEVRSCEIRNASPAEDAGYSISGVPVVFDVPTVIHTLEGDYVEIIRAGALDDCDLSDVTLRIEHDDSRIPLARTPNTMKLSLSLAGLNMTAVLPDTADGKAVYEAIKRQDLRAMSFAFVVPKGGDSYDVQTNTRVINRIAKIYECSIVANPAYNQTSVEARSVQKEAKEHFRARENARYLISEILSN